MPHNREAGREAAQEASQRREAKPQGSAWTDDQWEAISLGGRHMLVAAAAGSGKTAVLVERIIRRISDERDPVDVDRLLVATFTKAAASEMKHRIREALEKELAKQPGSAHLRKQLALMGKASITTLHSFCLEVIQRYFSLIRLDPGFRIANETEAELLRQDLLEDMLESYYAGSGEDSAFWRLVDSFSGERSDDALIRLVQKLYDVSRSHPQPEYWLRTMAAMFGPYAGAEVPVSREAAPHEAAFPLAAASSAAVDFSLWESSLMQAVRLELEGAADLLRQAQLIAGQPGGPAPYLDNLSDDLLQVNALLEMADSPWSVLQQAFQSVQFGKLKPCKSDDCDKELQEQVKELRSRAKDQLQTIREELFGRTQEQFAAEIGELAPVLHALVDLVVDFGDRYRQAKAAEGLIDFADLEHYCLQILREPGSAPDELYPSQAALAYRRQFVEVLLDEYQDTNRVQEAIVALISGTRPGNRFMVGDVKQSIYRFRLAEPGLFMEKYKAYKGRQDETAATAARGAGGAEAGRRIDLARNFRSRKQVVDAVNFIFRQIMNETVGEIAYDERAELVYGASYPAPAGDCSAEMLVIDRGQSGEGGEAELDGDNEDTLAEATDTERDDSLPEYRHDPAAEAQELETAQLEARAIAAQIRRLLGGGGSAPFEVYDKRISASRPITFRDIVVLLRATQQWAPVLIEELKLQGIPAYAELSTGYFSATEVDVMLSLLKIIDNPYQDVPLAAVLRSPIALLSAEQLAQIRAAVKQGPFYEAVLHIADDAAPPDAAGDGLQTKLRQFVRQLEHWRNEARQGSLADLIWSIYRTTGYYDFAGALPGGLQRQANLRALYDRARQYESTSLRGLFRFLRFIERMQDSGGDLGTARALGEQEDVVRIMSIHKSKGLEFPVVFVAGMAKPFNQRDLNDSFLLHKELGFGPRFVDTGLRISYPTLPALAIRRRMKLELLAEEMRVLYVALTRAKEKLYLLGTVKSLDKQLGAWARHLHRADWPLPNYEVARARCYLDWVGPALLRHPQAAPWRERLGLHGEAADLRLLADASAWTLAVLTPADLQAASAEPEQTAPADDEELLERVRSQQAVPVQGTYAKLLEERLAWQYSYPDAPARFAKTTVSEMKRLAERNRLDGEQELPAPGLAEAAGEAELSRLATQLRRPRFMGEKRLTAAEKGTIVHAVMQNLPLTGTPSEDTIRAAMERMLERKLLTSAQSEAVDIAAILGFFATPLGQRMLRAASVKREVPFSYGLPASDVYGPDSHGPGSHGPDSRSTEAETVLIQGVIDCLFEDGEGLVLVDYKTDAARERTDEELRERYRVQIELYTRAVSHIWRKPVTAAYLYFFDGARLLDMLSGDMER